MKPIDDKKDKVVIRAVSRDKEGRKKVEKAELKTQDVDTIKYVEKKLFEKGVQRLDRHPVDGLGRIGKPPPKSGHGGKYTWEGTGEVAESELAPAIDQRDPKYVDEEAAAADEDVAEFLVGEVEGRRRRRREKG